MNRFTAAVAVSFLAAFSSCGGGDESDGDGAASFDDALSCITDEQGLRAAKGFPHGTVTTAAGKDVDTQTIEVLVKPAETGLGGPSILYVDFWPTAGLAQSDVGFGAASEGETIERVSDTATVTYGPDWGLGGPPELGKVKECV
jgi:hypothetical protein